MKKQAWISCLRIIATLAILWAHVNGTIWGNPDLFQIDAGQTCFFSVNYYIMKWSVPVFFMITGALLLNKEKEITYKVCFKKYFRHIFLALLVFGFIYGLSMQIFTERSFSVHMIAKTFLSIVTGSSFSHLWYLYTLLGIYLVLPVFKSFINKTDKKTLQILLSSMFVLGLFFPFIGSIFNTNIAFNLPIACPIFFLLMGYYIATYKINRPIALILGFLSLITTGIIAYVNPILDNPLLDNSSPLLALSAIGLFSLFSQSDSYKFKRFFKVDDLCFGVYLIHPAFIQVFYRVIGFTPLKFGIYPFGSILVFVVVGICSFAASFLLRLIPGFKKYIL